MSFENLKRNRDQISKLVQAAEAVGGGEKKSYADEREWKPTVDKAGNGYAVLRFLPAAEGSDLPWVRYWDHGFKGPTGQWYIENSLTSIGQPDPVGELNSRLWNSGHEEDKDTARKQKRRLHYVVNALVVEDPSASHNVGRVVLYKFGKKIFDKVNSRCTKLRKPDEFIAIIQNKSVTQIDKEFKQLTTKVNVPNGRLNMDTILLRALDK